MEIDDLTNSMKNITIDINKSYFDIKADYIKNIIKNMSNDIDYVTICYEYINKILSTTDISYFGKFKINENDTINYKTINIKTYLDNLFFNSDELFKNYQIIFICYQLVFINEYKRNYTLLGSRYVPSRDKYCRKMDQILCLSNLTRLDEIDIQITHDNMITNPADIILGDDFFEDIKLLFCNDLDEHILFVSPNQTFYDCDGFIRLNEYLYPGINRCYKKYTWTMETKDFFDFFENDIVNIICNNNLTYNSLIFFYSRIF